MECRSWEEQASALIDGELIDQEAAALFGHLSQCLGCRRFYGKLARLREQLSRDARSTSGPEQTPEEPSNAGRKLGKMGGERPRGEYVRVPRILAAAAVIVLIMLGGSTTALLFDGLKLGTAERIIVVGSLPTIEIEASYGGGPPKEL